MSTLLQPLSSSNRDRSLDILRGFALVGVLFIFCVSDIGTADNYSNTLADELIAWPKWLFIESRMYSMLILIFGIGFHVQLEKAKRNNASLVPVFTRRLIGLLILGFIHAILLSDRDILMFYACAGAFLLLARNLSSRQVFILLLVVFTLLITGVAYILFGNVWSQTRALVQPNNYPDHVQYNWQFFKLYHQMYGVYIEMLFHFLLGFWISKVGLLKKINENKKFRQKLLIISLVATATLIPFYYFWIEENFPLIMKKIGVKWQIYLASLGVRILWYVLTTACVTFYATTLISISASVKEKWFRPLASFGQMALSNYLMQSLILVPYLLILNKYKDVPPFEGFILFSVVLSLQLLFSTWWMATYKLGPFEWLLRSFTYWKWQPNRKTSREELRTLRLTTTAML
ncbi:MAG TPA: DUF418 domain-containing protein [Chitinophagaceae bacterium]|nr:DUF418 domain-containing protein [Chitinophagaceae bacterium]